MADEDVNKEKEDYEEPSLTDLEDVSGGAFTGSDVCITGGSVAGPGDNGPSAEEA